MSPELHADALEQVFTDLAAVARVGAPTAKFSEEFVLAALAATGALGGGVWLLADGEDLKSTEMQGTYQLHLSDLLVDDETARLNEHILRLAVTTQRPQQTQLPTTPSGANAVMLACPLREGHQIRGVVELAFSAEMSRDQLQRRLETLAGLCELAEDYFRVASNLQLAQENQRLANLDRFSRHVHRSVNRDATCFDIVSALPQATTCDRSMIFLRRGGRWRAAAVTGVDTIDVRAESIVAGERLAARVAAFGEPVWEGLSQTAQAGHALPPQLETVVDAFSESSHPRAFTVIPLVDKHGPMAVLLLEWFKQCPDEGTRQDVERAVSHAELAIANSLASSMGTRFARRGSSTANLIRLAAALIGALMAVWFFAQPVAFHLEARGELQPRHHQHVFAPDDGTMARLFVEHGDLVERGDKLFQLRSIPLERDLAELTAERQTLDRRLEVIRIELLSQPQSIEEQHAAEQLNAEEQQILERLKGVQATADLVQQQMDQLLVRSPIRGKVVSWDLERSTTDRQLRRGQPVLRVDDHRGRWELDLRLPENRIGHLPIQATNAEDNKKGEGEEFGREPEVQVVFRLASAPEQTRLAVLNDVGSRAETAADGRSYLPITATVDPKSMPPTPRAGATVTARIQCGRRSRAFVWFHQLAEYMRQRLFL